jgi:cadmium resistance protein CadD (predicted permease)
VPIDTINGPAWWVRTIVVLIYMGLLAGLEWGKGWWQDRWAAFDIGLVYALVILFLYWRVLDRRMRGRGFYFGFAVIYLSLAIFFFVMFVLGSKGFAGLMAFIWLAIGIRYAYLCHWVSQRTDDDPGIESLRLNK